MAHQVGHARTSDISETPDALAQHLSCVDPSTYMKLGHQSNAAPSTMKLKTRTPAERLLSSDKLPDQQMYSLNCLA